MSEEATVEPNPAAISGNPALHPETNKNIGSMADAFREAMSEKPAAEPAPAVEAETPAAEPEPEPAPVETEVKESRSSKDFRLIKAERDEAKSKVSELMSQLTALEDAAPSEEFEKLKKDYSEMSETLSLTNLERHPKFNEQYVKPIDAQIDRAKAYVPAESRDQLAKILSMPVSESRASALDDLVGELPASRQAYLQGIVNRIDEISYERDTALQDSKSSYQKLVEEESLISEKKTTERNTALEKSFKTMLKEAQDNIPIYQLREGDEEWNTGVRERVGLAQKILMEQNTFEDAATAALWAASGGALVEQNAALVEHNRRMQAELNKLTGAEPSAAGGSVTSGNSSSSKSGPVSFSDRVMGELKGMGIGR